MNDILIRLLHDPYAWTAIGIGLSACVAILYIHFRHPNTTKIRDVNTSSVTSVPPTKLPSSVVAPTPPDPQAMTMPSNFVEFEVFDAWIAAAALLNYVAIAYKPNRTFNLRDDKGTYCGHWSTDIGKGYLWVR